MENGIKKYDVIVIGGGSGTKLVQPVADLGLKVAVIEKERLGGTCLNWGCIPSKMLIHAAEVAHTIRESKQHHLNLNKAIEVDFSDLIEEVQSTTNKESDEIIPTYEKHPNIDYYHGKARFIAEDLIEIKEQKLTADKIFLAVGTRSFIPSFPGLEKTPYMTSKQALKNPNQPKKIIIIGGGYIACELGFFFQALRTEVHLLVRSSLLRREDSDIRAEFTKAFQKMMHISFNAEIQQIEYKDATFTVSYVTENSMKQIKADSLLIATGIRPWTDDLGLEHTKVKTNEKGFILVDKYLKTDSEKIWAFGDCIGRHFFRHTANYEGEYLFSCLFEKKIKKPIVYSPVPRGIFTFPQIGSVGKTEEDLRKDNINYVVGLNRYSDSARGMALKTEIGLAKLLFDRKTKKLLGGHCIGEEAINLVHMLIAFMKMGATLDDLLDTIYIHPALPEVIRNAARKAKKYWKKLKKEIEIEPTD